MSNLKGTDILSINKLISKKGPDSEKVFLNRLKPDTRIKYEKVMAVTWMPVETASEIMAQAAKHLYPQDPNGLHQLAKNCALDHFGGIYKFFLPLLVSPIAVIKRASELWKTFYGQGEVRIEDIKPGNKGGTLAILGNPSLTPVNLEFIGAWSAKTVEIAGAKNTHYEINMANPQRWEFYFTWN